MLSDRASAFAPPLMGSKHSIKWARICRKRPYLQAGSRTYTGSSPSHRMSMGQLQGRQSKYPKYPSDSTKSAGGIQDLYLYRR
jgi:hypothetical protein